MGLAAILSMRIFGAHGNRGSKRKHRDFYAGGMMVLAATLTIGLPASTGAKK
jgi:hypothetical protein